MQYIRYGYIGDIRTLRQDQICLRYVAINAAAPSDCLKRSARRKVASQELSLLCFFPHVAHGLSHCDFIPQVVHVPVWVQHLGTIAPELAPWWTDERHTKLGQLMMLTVHIADLNGERDFLSR